MFISIMEFGSLMVFFIWGRTSTSEIIYSLISLSGTPFIFYLGMEDNRNNDIAHAKKGLNSFKKKKSTNEQEDVQSQRGKNRDDVRVKDVSEDKDVDHIPEELPSASSTSTKTPAKDKNFTR